MILDKLQSALFIVVYRLKSTASKIVVEDYDDSFDAALFPLAAFGFTLLFTVYATSDSGTALSSAVSAILAVFSLWLTAVHLIAAWYYATEPTAVDAEWVVSDG